MKTQSRPLDRPVFRSAAPFQQHPPAAHLTNLPANGGGETEKRGRRCSAIEGRPNARPGSPHGLVQLAAECIEGCMVMLQSACSVRSRAVRAVSGLPRGLIGTLREWDGCLVCLVCLVQGTHRISCHFQPQQLGRVRRDREMPMQLACHIALRLSARQYWISRKAKKHTAGTQQHSATQPSIIGGAHHTLCTLHAACCRDWRRLPGI